MIKDNPLKRKTLNENQIKTYKTIKMKKNDKVTIVVETPWATTEEDGIIEEITDTEIFIKELEIPFHKETGIKTESFAGAKVYIKELQKR